MAEKFREREQWDFPLNAFSDDVYQLVVADDRSLADELRRAMRRRREDQEDTMLALQKLRSCRAQKLARSRVQENASAEKGD
jgi:hypothetical protein